jgi:hypothetical protein
MQQKDAFDIQHHFVAGLCSQDKDVLWDQLIVPQSKKITLNLIIIMGSCVSTQKYLAQPSKK